MARLIADHQARVAAALMAGREPASAAGVTIPAAPAAPPLPADPATPPLSADAATPPLSACEAGTADAGGARPGGPPPVPG